MASGITCSEAACAAFRAGDAGMVQLQIVDETVEVTGTAPPTGSDEEAFASAQAVITEESNAGGVIGGEPCYIALKLPSLGASSAMAWVMLLYIPSGCSVRDRMLYASTKDTVKKDLGASNFASDLYGNTKDELTLAAYTYKQDGESAGPATAVEAELEDMAKEESMAASGGAQAGVAVAFSLKPGGRDALAALAKGERAWVSLSVNTDDESIEFVDGFAELGPDQWPSKLPKDQPRYVFIKLGDMLAMVYYCPDAAPIKQKMLGSTVKASAQAQASKRALITRALGRAAACCATVPKLRRCCARSQARCEMRAPLFCAVCAVQWVSMSRRTQRLHCQRN